MGLVPKTSHDTAEEWNDILVGMVLHVPVQKRELFGFDSSPDSGSKQTAPALVKQRNRIGAAHFSWAAARTITYILSFVRGIFS